VSEGPSVTLTDDQKRGYEPALLTTPLAVLCQSHADVRFNGSSGISAGRRRSSRAANDCSSGSERETIPMDYLHVWPCLGQTRAGAAFAIEVFRKADSQRERSGTSHAHPANPCISGQAYGLTVCSRSSVKNCLVGRLQPRGTSLVALTLQA